MCAEFKLLTCRKVFADRSKFVLLGGYSPILGYPKQWWPVGTFIVNVFGSFLVGLTFADKTHWHDFLALGFAGAFTTWSTFILDLYLGYELKKYKEVAINLTLSLVFGLAAAWFGLQIAS